MGCLAVAVGLVVALLFGVGTTTDVLPVPPLATVAPITLTGGSVQRLCAEYRVRSDDTGDPAEDARQARAVVAARLAAMDVAGLTVEVQGDHLVVEALVEEAVLRRLIDARGDVAFVPVPTPIGDQDIDWYLTAPELADVEPLFGGEGIARARALQDESGLPAIDLELTSDAAAIFVEHVAGHQGERLAIVVDDLVVAAPVIRASSFDGQARITGDLPIEDLAVAAALMTAGPLSADLEETRIGLCR